MKPTSAEIAKEFCEACNWAHQCWMTHRTLFDDNSDPELMVRNLPYFHEYLWGISLQYTYLQISKLHDPAYSRTKSANASISYVLNELDWNGEKDDLLQLSAKLNALYSEIRKARNKVIAHNDLDTVLRGDPVGSFAEGTDIEYFQCLQELVSRVHEKWFGEPYPFKDRNFGRANALEYLAVFRTADSARNSLNPPV